MTNNAHGSVARTSGERLIVLLTSATVALGLLIAYPALVAQGNGTAAQTQERVNMPIVVASYLDADARSSIEPASAGP